MPKRYSKKTLLFFFFGALGVATALVLTARDPSQLVKEEVALKPPPVIKVKTVENKPEPPPPETPRQPNPLAQLAPETMSPSLADLGAGIGFGQGGSGPAVAGQGGFGADAASLVKDQGQVDRPPRATYRSPPEYPVEAKQRGVSGHVTLRILVAANGAIEDVRIEKSEPAGFFDQSALKAIRSWRFDPAVSDGRAMAAWTTQRIKFELN